MKTPVQTVGFVLMVMGVSGTIDHLWVQPIMGPFLNVLNRFVFPHIDLLAGRELYANLAVAALGVVVMVVAEHTLVDR